MSLTDEKVATLEKKAAEIRCSIIEMLIEAKSGHMAGPLDMADIFAYLYFHALKHDPKKPTWPYRDRLVLSNGHICPVLYATMAHAGRLSSSRRLRVLECLVGEIKCGCVWANSPIFTFSAPRHLFSQKIESFYRNMYHRFSPPKELF